MACSETALAFIAAYRIRIFMSTYCFVPLFRKAKFCGVPLEPLVKLSVQWVKKGLRNTALRDRDYITL
jgi:hypothetical protein